MLLLIILSNTRGTCAGHMCEADRSSDFGRRKEESHEGRAHRALATRAHDLNGVDGVVTVQGGQHRPGEYFAVLMAAGHE